MRRDSKTPEEQASRSRTNIAVRLIGCGWLVYTVVQMARQTDFLEGPLWRILIASAIALAGAVIIALTVAELIRNFRSGFYKAESYSDSDGSGSEE
jgi:hypothetical protein